MAQKEKIHVYVDSEVAKKFREYVFAKYGTLHSYFGEELTKAMDFYLKHAADAHTQEVEHIISKPSKRHLKLLVWLAREYPVEILHTDLEKFVVENFGSDKRTKKKYINEFLIRMGYIKQKKALYGRNILYEVNFRKIYDYLKRHFGMDKLRELGILEIEERSGIIVERENSDSEATINDAKDYAVERYEAGDDLETIQERMKDFNLKLSKKAIRDIIRKSLRKRKGYG